MDLFFDDDEDGMDTTTPPAIVEMALDLLRKDMAEGRHTPRRAWYSFGGQGFHGEVLADSAHEALIMAIRSRRVALGANLADATAVRKRVDQLLAQVSTRQYHRGDEELKD